MASWLNRWPYRCGSCDSRFWADRRWPAPRRPEWQPKPARPTVARIEVHAASPAQLDEMLVSLNQALSRFQTARETASHTAPGVEASANINESRFAHKA